MARIISTTLLLCIVFPLAAVAAPVTGDNSVSSEILAEEFSALNISEPVSFDNDDDGEIEESDEDFSYLDEPVPHLEARALGDINDPKPAAIDCTGIEELCDANCYAILCLNRPSLLQKVGQSQARSNRRQCGAAQKPFAGTPALLNSRGVARPDSIHVSAEEFPFASTSQGGQGADLFPVTVDDQDKQKDAINGMYRNYGVAVGDWFQLSFANANTPYCNALAVGDYSVCDNPARGPWGFDFGIFAYVRDSLKNQALHYSDVGK